MEKKASNSRTILITVFILFFFLMNSFILTVSAEESEIFLYITDDEGIEISEIYEGEEFIVSLFDQDNTYNNLIVNATIEFNNKEYKITIENNREVILQAPSVESDKDFTIKAKKENLTIESKITVNNLNLQIEPKNHVVEANRKFSVTVTDGEQSVEGVTVYIESFFGSEGYKTNDNGVAILKAPSDRDEIRIIATYGEYAQQEITLAVNIEPAFFEEYGEYIPIAFAAVILVAVVIFVNFRQKKAVFARAQEITNQKKIERYGLNDKYESKIENNKKDVFKESSLNDQLRVSSKPDSKVEEIRISRGKREKEIVPLKTNEDKTKEILNKKKNQINKNNQDWFKGTDDVKYEIDKLTGKVDEEGVDKWFEGVDNLKEKIDEKVKKDKKKRKDDEE